MSTISTWAELVSVVNGNLTGSHTLEVDLDADSPGYTGIGDAWAGLGTSWGAKFTGTFDGQNHSVSDIIQNSGGPAGNYCGLFGYTGTGCIIKNVAVLNIDINVSIATGCISGLSAGTIDNCYATGNINGYAGIGGISGGGGVVITNCYTNLNIVSIGPSVGGITPTCSANITNCFSDSIIGTTGTDHGGLIGTYISGTITNCGWNFHTGEVAYAIGSTSGNITYNLTNDASPFYDKTHGIYTGVTPWDFTTPIWYEVDGGFPELQGSVVTAVTNSPAIIGACF